MKKHGQRRDKKGEKETTNSIVYHHIISAGKSAGSIYFSLVPKELRYDDTINGIYSSKYVSKYEIEMELSCAFHREG